MRREVVAIIAILLIYLAVTNYAFSQFTINVPKLPKVSKPKPDQGKTGDGVGTDQNQSNRNEKPDVRGGEPIYRNQRPTATPVLLKNSIYVQAKTHNEYWKMPGQRNYSSWVPLIRFNLFYNNEKTLNYTVEYLNPDGSAWYSEKLEQGNSAADRTVMFQSPSPYGGILDTKSTAATGLYGFKITNQESAEVVYKGKFRVGKFSTSNSAQEKNKVDFYVEHDWLLPFGMVGFHHSDIEIGGIPPEISVWLKGSVEADELEGRVYYKGQQIASTKDPGGSSGVSDYDERTTEFAPPFAPDKRWKRWLFTWNNFRFDNNGGFNRDYYPNAHYADKNPGDYTVKIYRNGTQIRELGFAIGADGKFVVPTYTDQIFLPYYRIIVPVKVIGTEKWDLTSWKTDAFYGNPLTGFTPQ